MIGAIGAEIDRLELEIRQAVPGIRHIDLVSLLTGQPSSLHSVYVTYSSWLSISAKVQLAVRALPCSQL